MVSVVLLYSKTTLIILLVALWWGIAFRPSPPQPTSSLQDSPVSPTPSLSFVDREELKRALRGDCTLMGRLMAEWDLDAQLLGGGGLKRLPSDRFLRGQL